MIIDGKKVAIQLRNQIKTQLAQFSDIQITLATVLVGEDPASKLYVGMKHREAHAAGIHSKHVSLQKDIDQQSLEAEIEKLASDDNVNGILVQLPLPKHINKDRVLAKIPAEKDVDGLTEVNMGRLIQGQNQLVPCTPLGVMRLIEAYNIPTCGKTAVVVGRSSLVGLPQMLLLSARGADATVTLAHSRSENLVEICQRADILVSAVGSAGMITAAHVKPGAMVFDVGVTRTADGILGDVDFTSVEKIAGGVTPMPAGTGPMTVACLLENTVKAASLQGILPI
ncbi:MAG: bifunctional 5,10-methylenetetrahydrofolate dehydrogenase/5,10-methenyltetrahydrofolate cyclohydrolase [Gammaproteobacteria bacterium]|nr:bifunctional 5,10-methylenetetrahydrofolate dehydrogenase/5,10-methenyltetrahydrofolate cyclohydrolase [Gammaproteobacteria bacterium]